MYMVLWLLVETWTFLTTVHKGTDEIWISRFWIQSGTWWTTTHAPYHVVNTLQLTLLSDACKSLHFMCRVVMMKYNEKNYGIPVVSGWWSYRSGSSLAQVMACCLTAPSHYLNQCWLITSKVQWHSSGSNFTRDTFTRDTMFQTSHSATMKETWL